MAEEVNGVATKLALGDVDDQSVLLESLEQQAKVFFVCLNILASHQAVVNVDEGEIQTITDNFHQALESLGSILQTEKHPEKLIQPERSDDDGFGDILSGHRDLVVALNKVDFGEHLHTGKVSREILYVRYWVPVRHCSIVEALVISTRMPTSRSFRYQV